MASQCNTSLLAAKCGCQMRWAVDQATHYAALPELVVHSKDRPPARTLQTISNNSWQLAMLKPWPASDPAVNCGLGHNPSSTFR